MKRGMDWLRASKEGLIRRRGAESFSENEIDRKPDNEWRPFSSAKSGLTRPKGALDAWVEDYNNRQVRKRISGGKAPDAEVVSQAGSKGSGKKKRKKFRKPAASGEDLETRLSQHLKKKEARMEADPEYAERVALKEAAIKARAEKKKTYTVEIRKKFKKK